MQAVILAAGRGTRMGSLTDAMPKPMLQVLGKPILHYVIESLPEEVDEVILIVGYFGSVVQEYFGGEFDGRKIFYVEQDELNGTGGALWAAKDLLHGKFLVMNGDDICDTEDMRKCLKYEWAVLGIKVEKLGTAGKIEIDKKGDMVDILEKESHDGGPGYANASNFFLLDTHVFDYPLVKRPKSEEYGLPQTIAQAAKDIPIHVVDVTWLLRFTIPEDIKKAEEMLQKIKGSP